MQKIALTLIIILCGISAQAYSWSNLLNPTQSTYTNYPYYSQNINQNPYQIQYPNQYQTQYQNSYAYQNPYAYNSNAYNGYNITNNQIPYSSINSNPYYYQNNGIQNQVIRNVGQNLLYSFMNHY